MIVRGLLLLVVLCIYTRLSAGDNPPVKYLGIEQGLSNDAVTSVFQDAKGFMWFGTYDGLNRYDGYGFTVYRNVIGDFSSLAFNNISSITGDCHQKLWVSGLKGISIFNPATGKFSVPAYLPWKGRAAIGVHEFVHVVKALDSGLVLAGTHADGLLVFDARTQRGWQVPLDGKGAYDVYAIEYDRFSKLAWIFIQGRGLYTYDVRKGVLRLFNGTIRDGFCLKVDRTGRLWLGTDSGLVWLDRARNTYSNSYLPAQSRVVCIDVNEANDLCFGTDGAGLWRLPAGKATATPLPVNSNAVYSVYGDREGRKWVGTLRGGINVIESRTSSFKTIVYDPPGPKNIINNFILSFCEDADHNVWIGTDGAGLRYWDRRNNTFRDYVGKTEDNFITGILRDDQDRLWLSTWFDGVQRLDRKTGRLEHFACVNPETGQEEKHVWMIVQDRERRIWASATNEGSLYRFDPAGGRFTLFDSSIQNLQSLTEDREGNLWGGNYNSLIRIDREHKRHRSYTIGYTIRCLHEDRSGGFWVGTQEGGLLLFDRGSGQYKQYTTADGLPSNTILRILEDVHGNLWMSTYNGLSELQKADGKFRNFSPSDGLQSTQFSFNGALALSTGEMLFGGIKGFNIFFPDSVLRRHKMPNVYITQVRVRNQPVQGDSRLVTARSETDIRELTVPFNQATLSLDFTALEYDGTDKIDYAYILEGWDHGWVHSNGNRTANYPSLREGSYVFKVKVSHADGTWSRDTVLLRIIVLAPWYRTWWAYAAYVLALGGLVFLYIQYTRSKIRLQLEAEKERELVERKLAFFTHITHEFRNPLTLIINPVKELMARRGGDEDMECLPFVHRNAQRLLGLVDQLLLFRKAEAGSDVLSPVPVDLVDLAREVHLCFVEGARAKKIDYRFESPAATVVLNLDKEKVEIALYNLLSNALKYTPDGGQVLLSIEEAEGEVRVHVNDTGRGIPPEVGDQVFDKFYQIRRSELTSISGFGIGLYLVRQFVEAHGGRVTYRSDPGKGTCFQLSFPKERLVHCPAGKQELSPLLREIALPATPPEAPARDLVSGRSSLLIVDDDEQILSYVSQLFEGQFTVLRARSGEEALALARERRPDLVISDVHLSGITGIEICETIKNDPLLGRTPVILLTASASAVNKLEGVKHGADDYITKPFDRDLLLARVSALLVSRERIRQSIYEVVTHGDSSARITAEDKAFLDQVFHVVENSLDDDEFSIKKLATGMGMSHSALYQKLKDITGQSLNGFIRFVRLKKAAELFINTNYNVNEVALQVGIGDGKYFREQFHKHYGLNPSDYIKKYRKGFSGRFQVNKDEFRT